ncbi:MAG: hypothetical protein ACI94Y_002983 [Maribacter sp.]|jgi:hypothetical protein
MKKTFFFCLILSVIYFLSCTDLNKKTSNTSNDSELTLLMRNMFDDGMKIKEAVLEGKKPQIMDKAKALMSAHSTDPEVAMSEEFKIFAQSYLAAVEALKEANNETITTQYETMVNSCMNCHRSLCPGPIVKIKKLYLDY